MMSLLRMQCKTGLTGFGQMDHVLSCAIAKLVLSEVVSLSRIFSVFTE